MNRVCRNGQAVSGEAAARAVVDDAKEAVADKYGIFVGFTDDNDDADVDDLNQSQPSVSNGHSTAGVEEKGHPTSGLRVAV